MVEAFVDTEASFFTNELIEKHSRALTFATMNMFRVGDQVKINPDVLEDQSVQSNHHLFQEALKHNVTGTIVELDTGRSKPLEFWYRVKFHFFTAPLKEAHLVLLSKA